MNNPTPDQIQSATYLELKQLRREFAEFRELVTDLTTKGNAEKSTKGWARPNVAAIGLKDWGVHSQKHLTKLREDGVFSELRGEIRNVSRGSRPTWEYNITKCRKALNDYFSNLSA
jgi:hypothetical protein